jgi:hypothetical protein
MALKFNLLTVTICPSASCKSLTGTPTPFKLPAAAIDIVLKFYISCCKANQKNKINQNRGAFDSIEFNSYAPFLVAWYGFDARCRCRVMNEMQSIALGSLFKCNFLATPSGKQKASSHSAWSTLLIFKCNYGEIGQIKFQ